ncbi:MAG TPA: Wzz/FepE/Etk N-terminal domain-containing protein, partial [Dissulfurispiraceae bacterium]|nr:Wzz/FepE/Etk N-terminal domain-containing protein [Dissulfurispiraceae bacterium]
MNFIDYWRIIKQRKSIVLLAFVTTVLTTLIASLLWPPKYESVATIMLDYDSSNPMNISTPVSTAMPTSIEYVNTQIALIQSRRIAEDVASTLNLDKSPKIIAAFDEAKEGNPIFFWRKPMKMDIKTWIADELLLKGLKVDAV